MPLSPEYKVLSEQMRDLGYYCVNIMGRPYQLEFKNIVDVDGTVDLTGASMYIVDRRYEWQQCYDMDLLAYFINIAREHTKSFCTWGRNWPEMLKRKPEWFGEEG